MHEKQGINILTPVINARHLISKYLTGSLHYAAYKVKKAFLTSLKYFFAT